MRKIVYKHTLGFLLLFVLGTLFSQNKYDAKATPTQISLEGKTLKGYKTNFDFNWENVRRGWWKYAREFGTPLNMKTYYKVTIPSSTTDGNVDLEIFTQTTEVKGGSEFFLGLENEKYKAQAMALILDFKKKYYIDVLVATIDLNLKKANELGDRYKAATSEKEQQELLKEITELEKENDQLKEWIKGIEREN
ncbi:hypothetical protein [Ekhidna sp.]|uniref:hypothetical protein n=1 Tax=Ekhidna sp. TaxID=2608089 RepID=UPI0035120E69